MGDQFNFQDIFKKSFLEVGMMSDVSILTVIIGLSITFVISLFIYQVYKTTYKGVVYSQSFNLSLMMISMVTSLVIMTISSNVVLSLGMVGALSIVRFRAAIKDPKDVVFMFWAIAAGIASGARIYTIAIGGSAFIGVVILLMSYKSAVVSTYLLILKYKISAKESVLSTLKNQTYELKSKVVKNGVIEMTLELTRVGDNTSYVEAISEMDGVESAILVKYNGDYTE